MKTVDELLTDVVSKISINKEITLAPRDAKTFISLHETMSSLSYITEKQSNLCLQLLNQIYIRNQLDATALAVLDNPTWNREFRILPEFRNIYHIPAGSEKIPVHWLRDNYVGAIAIEFSFSTNMRNVLRQLSSILVQVKSGTLYMADYTESNLYKILSTLELYNFDVDPELQSQYEMIKSWNKENLISQYMSENMDHELFNKMILGELGNKPSELIIADRKHRYCYSNEVSNTKTTLTEIIAHRKDTKMWINNDTYKITDIVKSLIELNRFPVLIVFDQQSDLKMVNDFNEVTTALTDNGITDNIGFYFRLDNTPDGKLLNDTITERQYNCMLDENTKVACVKAGKLPKFFLRSNWKPLSVISVNNSLRQSKTAIYSKCCDLVIAYTNIEPIIETRNTWQ